jgi:hypothetical protein
MCLPRSLAKRPSEMANYVLTEAAEGCLVT